ncbi:divalent-cation tolerance protein CutA [Pseudogulbenkiania subflava]|uniref:Divalent cation tolerance protein n=1 Tax=Pseudogulbenkiania subflava DSM 22618 TaxID=1123014 RepID=A0A1Y6B9B2_9NEIS|nr:divalent-cation tolerance protein CutA [Pseudogulbenkiania subflava]SME91342.1 divalent cation tolerance protein [Pseudogulbenkiania subflava DSM 22618]
MSENKCLLVLCNTPDRTTASRIARQLVEERLAACVNILPEVQSVYRWQGRIEEASEVPLLVKTTQQAYAGLERRLVELHPYEVPEIVACDIAHGLPAYLTWVAEETLSSPKTI